MSAAGVTVKNETSVICGEGQNGTGTKAFLNFLKTAFLDVSPTKGDVFLSQVINRTEQFLEVLVEKAQIVHHSTKAFAFFYHARARKGFYGIYMGPNRLYGHSMPLNTEYISHVN